MTPGGQDLVREAFLHLNQDEQVGAHALLKKLRTVTGARPGARSTAALIPKDEQASKPLPVTAESTPTQDPRHKAKLALGELLQCHAKMAQTRPRNVTTRSAVQQGTVKCEQVKGEQKEKSSGPKPAASRPQPAASGPQPTAVSCKKVPLSATHRKPHAPEKVGAPVSDPSEVQAIHSSVQFLRQEIDKMHTSLLREQVKEMQTQLTKQQSHNGMAPTVSTLVIKHKPCSGAAKKAPPTNCAKRANGNTTPPVEENGAAKTSLQSAKTQAKPKEGIKTATLPIKCTPPKPPAKTVAAALKSSNASNNIGTKKCVDPTVKKSQKPGVFTKPKPKDDNSMQARAKAATSLGGHITPIAERKGTKPRF